MKCWICGCFTCCSRRCHAPGSKRSPSERYFRLRRSGSDAADVLECGLDRLACFSSRAGRALDEIANLPYRHREHREVVCVSGLDVGEYLHAPLDGLRIVRDPGADALRDGAVPRFAQHVGGERALLVVEVLPQGAAGERFPALLTGEPVAWMGWLAQLEGMLLVGRVDDACAVLEGAGDLPRMGALDGMTRDLAHALAFVLAGHLDDARPHLKQALVSAKAVGSPSGAQAANALLAEVAARTGEGDPARLLTAAGPATDGIAATFVLRARAALGDDAARADLLRMTEDLAAPGLAMGTDGH